MKTPEEILKLSGTEQNHYLETLPRSKAEYLAHAILEAETDRLIQKLAEFLDLRATRYNSGLNLRES